MDTGFKERFKREFEKLRNAIFDDSVDLQGEEREQALVLIAAANAIEGHTTFRGLPIRLNATYRDIAEAYELDYEGILEGIFAETEGLPDEDAFKKIYAMSGAEEDFEEEFLREDFDGCLASMVNIELIHRINDMVMEKEQSEAKLKKA